jgi:hypothetical protein
VTRSFTANDGLSLAYYIDDFTNPWAEAPTLLLPHAAMGSARRYFGCRTYDGLPHDICDAVPDRCAGDVRDFLARRFPAS